MAGPTKDPTLKKLLKRFVLLVVTMLVYLVLGALAFRKLENDHNLAAQRRFIAAAGEFLVEHPCLKANDTLAIFLGDIKEAVSMSVISITRTSWVRDADVLWDLPTSFFFAFTVVSTVGYGNFTPTTDAGRMVCSFYALVGIPLTGWFILTVGNALHGCWQKIRRFTHRLTIFISWPRTRHVIHFVLYSSILTIALMVIPGAVLSFTESWPLHDAIYYCFISLSTIGFGDLVAGDRQVRSAFPWLESLALVVWLLFGLSVMAAGLKSMAKSQTKSVERAQTVMRKFVNKATIMNKSREPALSTPSAEFPAISSETPID